MYLPTDNSSRSLRNRPAAGADLNRWAWLVRVVLALLLVLAVCAMGLGWSGLSGNAAAVSESL